MATSPAAHPDGRRVGQPHGRHDRARAVPRRRVTTPSSCSTPMPTATSARRPRSSASSTAPIPRRSSCASTPATSPTAARTTSRLIRDYPDRIRLRPPQAGRPGDPRRRVQEEQLGFAPGGAPRRDGRAAARRAGHAGRARRRSPRSTGTCSASSSRTCTRATPTVPLPDRDPDPASTSRRAASARAGRSPPAAPARHGRSEERRHDHPRRGHRHGPHRRPTTRRKLAHVISGSTVSVVTDVNRARAEEVAAILGGARVVDDGLELIASRRRRCRPGRPRSGRTHAAVRPGVHRRRQARHVRKAARARPCRNAKQILEAEVALGRRLVIVGFMRRYDPGLPAGQGRARRRARSASALILHNVHRNPTVPRVVHELHDDDRLDDPRGRHHPLAAGRGDRRGPGHPAEADAKARVAAPPGPAVRGVHDRVRDPRRPSSSSPTASTATTSAASSWARTGRRRHDQPDRRRAGRRPGSTREPVPPSWRDRFGDAYTRRAAGVDQRPRAGRDRRRPARGRATRRRGSPSSASRRSTGCR